MASGRPARGVRALAIGLGNASRRDDAAGLEVARRIRALSPTGLIDVREHEGEMLGLLDVWEGAQAVVLIDAVRSGAPPGTIHRLEASSAAIPTSLRGGASTHAVGLAEAIELARALGRLPDRLVIFGVEGGSFDHGRGLSPEVQAVVGPLAEAVVREAGDWRRDRSSHDSRRRPPASAGCRGSEANDREEAPGACALRYPRRSSP